MRISTDTRRPGVLRILRAVNAAHRKILVMLDIGAPRHPAVAEAARLAAREGAELQLYHCGETQELCPGWADTAEASGVYRQLLQRRHLDDLQRLAAPLREEGLTVSVAAVRGPATDDAIRSHLQYSAPDLIIKDAGDPARTPRDWHQRTDELLLRHALCPFLLIGAASSAVGSLP
jgi:universal stress protein E